MNVYQMVNHLGVRLKDGSATVFTDDFKLEMLNNAQKTLCHRIHPTYLTELETFKTNVAVSDGILTIAALLAHATGSTEYADTEILRGADGILSVKNYNGKYARKIEVTNRKDMENKFLEGTVQNPLYAILNERIYIWPTTITAVDVHYLRLPYELYYKITVSALAGGASTTGFSDAAATPLITEDDYYNGLPIYLVTQGSYHVITDQVKTPSAYTVSPAAGAVIADSSVIFFVAQDFDQFNKRCAGCELNPSLHPIMLDLAEEQCWLMDNKPIRRVAAGEAAELKIGAYNLTQKEATGIGTYAERRAE